MLPSVSLSHGALSSRTVAGHSQLFAQQLQLYWILWRLKRSVITYWNPEGDHLHTQDFLEFL